MARRFSNAETQALLRGVIMFGRPWQRILNHVDFVEIFQNRSANDLMWKFRNTERADEIRVNTPLAGVINPDPEGLLEIQVHAPVAELVPPSRDYIFWTIEETDSLHYAVFKHSTAARRWLAIKSDPEFAVTLGNKSNDQLKSKWVNVQKAMTRIALAALHNLEDEQLENAVAGDEPVNEGGVEAEAAVPEVEAEAVSEAAIADDENNIDGSGPVRDRDDLFSISASSVF